ncbi:MAG TPA: anti-sigma factor [Puia sp.]|nr:anti-sigma factor [Puia sp.]
MNLKEYIASGIIESYVMGLASESEKAEFEQMCAQYPELVAERRKFEESLEAYASEQAVRPPLEVKAKILKIITMENSKSPRSSGLLRFVAAAAVILLIGMVVLYYQVNQQNKELADSNRQLGDRLNQAEVALNKVVQEISGPSTTVVNMVGTKREPKASANVYWDSTSSNVYLLVKNMPELPSDQQYQLWALIDNKQKNLGVFDAKDKNIILKMDSTKKAQAFAITIEKKGGSPHPTLDSLQSVGKTQLTQ